MENRVEDFLKEETKEEKKFGAFQKFINRLAERSTKRKAKKLIDASTNFIVIGIIQKKRWSQR